MLLLLLLLLRENIEYALGIYVSCGTGPVRVERCGTVVFAMPFVAAAYLRPTAANQWLLSTLSFEKDYMAFVSYSAPRWHMAQ